MGIIAKEKNGPISTNFLSTTQPLLKEVIMIANRCYKPRWKLKHWAIRKKTIGANKNSDILAGNVTNETLYRTTSFQRSTLRGGFSATSILAGNMTSTLTIRVTHTSSSRQNNPHQMSTIRFIFPPQYTNVHCTSQHIFRYRIIHAYGINIWLNYYLMNHMNFKVKLINKYLQACVN